MKTNKRKEVNEHDWMRGGFCSNPVNKGKWGRLGEYILELGEYYGQLRFTWSST